MLEIESSTASMVKSPVPRRCGRQVNLFWRTMKLTGSYTISVPREKVFAAITAPAVLQRCIDGCEKMVKTTEDSYDAHLRIGVAGLKGNYTGKVQMKDQKPPESYTLILEGKGGPGFVKGTAQIRLSEQGGQTE